MQRTPSLHISSHRTPANWLTPTHLTFEPLDGYTPQWQSRRSRKGRYALKSAHVHAGSMKDERGAEWARMLHARIRHERVKMEPGFYLDISWWLAFVFTLGSSVWVVNGFLVWFPILRPSLDTKTVTETASATAFVGASIFEIGGYLGVIEVLVRSKERHPDFQALLHHHRGESHDTVDNIREKAEAKMEEVIHEGKGWVWWGKPLWHDMGYLAAIVQFCAATIFWIPCLTGLPGVIPGFADGGGSKAIIDVFYWTPQVIGGSGFIISSTILMLEVQRKWYIPALTDLGWWIAFWNLIGAIGFTLCGALGYSSRSGVVYQSALATWWGSWAFLIGSALQLLEASFREPQQT